MKSIAQIVQNNRRLLVAYEDKVQPRFLSRYAREPMDAAVEGLGAGRNSTSPTSSRRSAGSPGSEVEDLAEANGLKLGGASHVGMVYFCTLTKKSAIGEAGK